MAYKILMIAPTPFFADRGCHVRIYEEIKSLQKIGHRVSLFTYPLGRDINGIDIRRIIRIPWYRKLEAGPSWHKFYLDELLYRKIKKTLRRESFDLIHAHLHEGVFIAGRLRKKFNLPVIGDLQGSMTDEIRSHGFLGNHRSMMKGFFFVEKRINRKADLMMMSSKRVFDLFRSEFGIAEEKMRIVADAVDTDIFYFNASMKGPIKEKLNIPKDRQVIAFLGLLNHYQGMDILLQIIPQVIQKVNKVHFLIMGFPNEKHYQKICEERNLHDHVTFTGRIAYADTPQYLSAADIAISPKISKTEGNGKLMNYMAMGLPVVVFDNEVNREILSEYGIYASFGNADHFAEKLIYLLQNPQKGKELGTLLRQRAITDFSWDQRAKTITEAYDEVTALKS